jgi:hypothetical protein
VTDQPDHSLTVDAPYQPDWWCLPHNRSGHGTGCPDCTNDQRRNAMAGTTWRCTQCGTWNGETDPDCIVCDHPH